VTLVAMLGVAAGIHLTAAPRLARQVVPFSGGMLAGLVAFWVTPEMAESLGWPSALAWVSVGFILLWGINRFVYPVCPSCSHTHDHDECATRLHGFAAPMLIAAGLHSLLDGWTLAAAQQGTTIGTAFVAGIALHKIPEGLAFGVIVRASLKSRWSTLAGCALAESFTIVGAVLELALRPWLGDAWAHGLLGFAAGTFLYLGYHAVHSEYKRRGAAPAFMPALTGVAGTSVIRLFGRYFF
jgi:zinc transporter ZupT